MYKFKLKYISTLTIITAILLISHFSVFASEDALNEYPVIRSVTDYAYPVENFNDLENPSNTIIKATVLPDNENIMLDDIWGYTKTKLKVNKVYQGDMEEGAIIYLREPYYHLVYVDGDEFDVFENNYDKCEVDREYIFFLGKYNDIDLYGLINGELGRYPVLKETRGITPDIDSLSNEDLDLWKDDTTTYREVYSEVLEKYN